MQNDHTSIVNVYRALVLPEALAGNRIASQSLAKLMTMRVEELHRQSPGAVMTFADLACGMGADAYAMTTGRMFPDIKIKPPRLLISDINPSMIERAKEFLANKNDMLATKVEAKTCDLTKDRLSKNWQGKADIALIANTAVLFDEDQLVTALGTAKSVLKKQGRLYVDFRDWESLVKNPPGTQEWENEVNGMTYVVRYDYHIGNKPQDSHKADISVRIKGREDIAPATFTAHYQGINESALSSVFMKAGLDIVHQGYDDRGPGQRQYNTFELKLAA